jgi:hypothetical protein
MKDLIDTYRFRLDKKGLMQQLFLALDEVKA